MKKPSAAQQRAKEIRWTMDYQAKMFAAFERSGDIRWLEQMERAIIQQCRILGIELPSERVAELGL